MKKKICLIILSLAIGANAATFNVSKTADTADGTCDTDCSLREAITAANALAGTDTIVLPAGIYTTTIVSTGNENANANGDLDISDSVTIAGAGAASTFVEANASPGVATDRVFHVLGGSTNVVIEDLTVRNGRTTSTSTLFRGGGIYATDANLTVRTSTVSGNSAQIGGGIRNDVSPRADMSGLASLAIESSTISGNSATDGGGIANNPTPTTVDAAFGGTLNFSLKNSTVSGNSAANNGGGIFHDQPAGTTANAFINNSTIVSNQADSDSSFSGLGGGIDNTAGTVTIKNTIVANNVSGTPLLAEKFGSSDGYDLAGNFVSADYNLFEITEGAVITGMTENNITGSDPDLASFAENGGFGRTYRLNPGSAARNAGDPTNCQDNLNNPVTVDQRGLPRDQGGARCDIGALEEGGITWDGGGADNNFTTAENWEGDVVPNTSNYAIFNSTSGKNITVNGMQEVRGVIYGGGYTGNMTIDGGNLRVRDIFYLYGGNITCLNDGFLDMASDSNFVRYSGHVIGFVNHDFIAFDPENFVFPVGTNSGYKPVSVNYSPNTLQEKTSPNNLGVITFRAKANEGSLPDTDPVRSLTMNWTLESEGVAPADLTLNYNDEDVPSSANEESFIFIRREGETNMEFTPSSADTFDNSFRLDAVTQFSGWTLGNLFPLAASASVSGRVLTCEGRGLENALVTLSGGDLTSPINVRTSAFGYYDLPQIPVGQTYFMTVRAKNYTFSTPNRFIQLQDNIENYNFAAECE